MSTKYIASNWRLLNKAGVDSYKSDNYGLTFNGVDDIITIDTSTGIDFSNPFSVSLWAKWTAADIIDNTAGIVQFAKESQSYSFMIGTGVGSSNDTFSVSWNNNHYEFGSGYGDGNWHQIVVTGNGVNWSGVKIYIDNTDVTSSASSTSSIGINSTVTYIGQNTYSGNRQFKGSISELAGFTYELSESQISTLYGSSSLGAGNPMVLNPVAYYPLGDNSASNPLTQPNEAVEDASVFDFDSDYINCGNSTALQMTGDISVSAWFRTSNSGSQMVIVGRGHIYSSTLSSWCLFRRSNNGLGVQLRSGSAYQYVFSTATTYNDGKWHNVFFTRETSSGNLKLYIDGDLAAPTTTGVTSVLDNETQNTYIGADTQPAEYFDGEISNVAVWNSDQSSEISNIYNSGVPATTYTNTPTAWYKLDQSANWEADSSGNWQIPDANSAYPQSFSFDGSSGQEIALNNNTLINGFTSATFSFWFKGKSGLASFDGLLCQRSLGSDYCLIHVDGVSGSNYKILMQQGGGGYARQDSGTLQLDKWYHVCVKGTVGSIWNIYINGQLSNSYGSAQNISGIVQNTNPFRIGRDGITNVAVGEFSNVQIFNTELPATGTDSVETLYNNGTPLTTAIASDNLKAWYKLDNTATFSTNWSIPDASGNGNTGTSSGMTEQNLVNNNVSVLNGESSGMTSANLVLSDLTRAVPYDSYSFNFDSAANDYIDCGLFSNILSDMSNTTKFTISCWYKTDGTGYKGIFGSGGFVGLSLYFNSGDVIFTADSTAKIQASCTYGDNNWHHLTCVYDGSAYDGGTAITMRLYFDGTEIGTDTDKRGSAFDSSKKFWIGGAIVGGAGTTSPNPLFNGSITQLSIFDEALTSTEVLKLYSNGVPQDLANFTPAPVAWYPLGSNSFWNGSQWTVRDMIGSNDGTGQNIGVDGLVGDSPRSSANGVGTNNSIPENLVGTTKWSSNNSWSINMSSEARVEDTP